MADRLVERRPPLWGVGIRRVDTQARWVLTGESALLFAPVLSERKPMPDGDYLKNWQSDIS